VRRATFLASARDDLVDIFDAIARASDSLSLAERYASKLRDRCHHLASLPGSLGRPRPELRADIRSAVFQNYVIFFRYVKGRFEVVNILHGHRDIDAHFEGEG